MDDEELLQYSKEELVDVVKKLSSDLGDKEDEVEELEKEIKELEKEVKEQVEENIRLSRGGASSSGAGGDDLAMLDQKNRDLQDMIDKLEAEKKKIREEMASFKSQNKYLEETNKENKGMIETLQNKVDALKRDLDREVEKSKENLRKSQDVSRQKQDTQKAQLQLYEEIEQMKTENQKLSDELKTHQENKILFDALIAKLADEKDNLEIEKENLELNSNSLNDQVEELKHDLENAQDKLQEVYQSGGKWNDELESLQAEFSAEMEIMENENDSLKQTVDALRKEVEVLKDSTQVGEKQRQVDALTIKLTSNAKLIDEMRIELETLSAEKKQLAERLISYDENLDQQIYERIGEERELARVLQKKNEALITRLQESEEEFAKEEKRSAELAREIDELNHWKSVYENGHGLQELARHQKKMKEDARRLGLTLEQMSAQLSETIESKNLLEAAFYKLKIETGKGEDFEYSELELRNELKGETGRLRLQVQELEEQIHNLEDDSVKLRKALKNQVATFGENGFKYAGMTPDQLVKVNEFANNIREGRIELPLDNRSASLLKDNRQVREDLRLAQLKINRYELELCGMGDDQPSSQPHSGPQSIGGYDEIQGLRVDVRNLLLENTSLQGSLQHMKDEISMLLQQQTIQPEAKDGKTESLVAMLMANNDNLVKENTELRRQLLSVGQPAPSSDRRADPPDASQVQSGHPPLPSHRTPSKGTAPLNSHSATQQHTQGFNTPLGRSIMMEGTGGNIALATPQTPHGKTILSKNLATMGPLPPEEWAEELKELNGQLIECLEQLFEKEEELNQQQEIIDRIESDLVSSKQQMSSLYLDFAHQQEKWTNQEKSLKREVFELRGEKEDLGLKLQRAQETLDKLNLDDDQDDPDHGRLVASLQQTVREQSRKLTVYEVNEAVLCRKFTTLNEQMQEESKNRRRAEENFAEMEGVLKRRILYLENYKAEMEPKLSKLNSLLDHSVPHNDYVLVENELENLRQDHLHALKRELAARVGSFEAQEKSRQVRQLKKQVSNLMAELKELHESKKSSEKELENQKEITQRILSKNSHGSGGETASADRRSRGRGDGSRGGEVGSLVSELANFRGEASRLQVELSSRDYRLKQAEAQVNEAYAELDRAEEKERELVKRCEEAEISEKLARKSILELEAKYDGGLTREEAETIRKEEEGWREKIKSLEQQNHHLKEMAQIASEQAQSLANIRDSYNEEVTALRSHLALYESRTDDDLIIGKLQRQLMATKTAYKAFTRKYHVLRGNMRQRELAQRVLEARLEQREAGALKLHETYRLEKGALRKALKIVYERMISARGATDRGKNSVHSAIADSGDNDAQSSSRKANPSAEQYEFHDQIKRIVNGKIPARDITGGGEGGFVPGSIGEKMALMSHQIEALSSLAESAGDRAAEAESKSSKLAGEVDSLNEDNMMLRKTIKNLNELLEGTGFIPGNTGAGGGSSAVNKKQLQSQTKAVAAKLLALSEENRTLRIASLHQKRETASLQQEKQHLRATIQRLEQDLEEMESNRMFGEEAKCAKPYGGLNGLFDLDIGGASEGEDELADIDTDMSLHQTDKHKTEDKPSETLPDKNKDELSPLQKRFGKKLSVDTATDEMPVLTASAEGPGDITKEELIQKNEQLSSDLISAQRDLSGYKRQCEHIQQRLLDAQDAQAEREEAIRYYERLATSENLPLLNSGYGRDASAPRPRGHGAEYRMMREEQEKLQEAASATIGSMRSLLEDKNKEIERLRSKIERQHSSKDGRFGSTPSLADRRAEELLARLAAEERYQSHAKRQQMESPRDGPSGHGADAGLVQRLMDQVDRADEILQDKERTVKQLELKVSTLHGQREKAEQRCGATLEEMESMKVDMVTLVQQLKESEEKYMKIAQYNQMLATGKSGDHSGAIVTEVDTIDGAQHAQSLGLQVKTLKRKNANLSSALKGKDDKLKQYRNIIINLKEEFIKSEEEKAAHESKRGSRGRGDGDGPVSGVNNNEIETLRDQVAALRDGLKQAKQDIEVAKRAREKLQTARTAAVKECEALEGQLGRAEGQAGAAQEALQRTRRELEESRKREVRLRQKVKDLLESNNEEKDDSDQVTPATDRLKREVEALQAENTLLRERVASGAGESRLQGKSISKTISDEMERRHPTDQQVERRAKSVQEGLDVDPESEVVDQGRVLGGGERPPEGNPALTDLRRQLHSKWESEKRLQKRVSTLESRLKEKVEECQDVSDRFRRAQQLVSQQAQQIEQAKDTQHQHSAKSKPKSTAEYSGYDVSALQGQLEDSREKVFSLEEENERLRRLATVQLPNELTSARHRNDTLASRLSEVEQELEEAEYQLKAARSGGRGESSLRASEDRFMKMERLKDELQMARKDRLELEASILERDSKSLEMRFDLEAKESENSRLRRRLKEVEEASRALRQEGVAARPQSRALTAGSRQQESESVIESLRKVVDKLKAENDRLRRGVGVEGHPTGSSPGVTATAGSDKDRKLLAAEKKKTAKLDEEVRSLREKVRQLEDGGQRLVQRQQQVASLRKQLKGKEERAAQATQSVKELEAENAQLKQRLSDSHNKLQQLEMQLATSQNAAASALSSAQRYQQQRPGNNDKDAEREVTELRRQVSQMKVETESLKSQLAEARRELKMARDSSVGPTGGSISRTTAEEQQLIKKLTVENKRLKDELSAFDIDFFEEIENLKYAHAEATKQLRWYEKKYGAI